MPGEPKLFTVEEANRLVPALSALLPQMRRLRDQIAKEKDLHDVEEIASHGTTGAAADAAREAMEGFKRGIRKLEKEFEKHLGFFEQHHCELKSIDPGLIDFYSERKGELVYLCWMEGEPSVGFWHPLSGGFAGRHPVD